MKAITASLFEKEQSKVYRVSEITKIIKTTLEDEIGVVVIEGEISNFRSPASGHWYFTLKDESSEIRAVMFRFYQGSAKCKLADGLQVRVKGLITVYEKGGEYQIMAYEITPAGQGELFAKFEALKKKLEAEGLFDAARKKKLPLLPLHIGIVTSPTGAAIRDMLNILGRRFPELHIIISPVRVQGEGAAEEIAEAIRLQNEYAVAQVLIVGRGGGSIEDLWAFNEECVARAIAASRIPVISAVGHEIDFTISDFVADLRAPTPSAAAELVIGRKEDFETKLSLLKKSLMDILKKKALELTSRLNIARSSHIFHKPRYLVDRLQEQVLHNKTRLTHLLQSALQERAQRFDELILRIRIKPPEITKVLKIRLDAYQKRLSSLNPKAILKRGYSITKDENQKIITDARDVKIGSTIISLLGNGTLISKVEKTINEEP